MILVTGVALRWYVDFRSMDLAMKISSGCIGVLQPPRYRPDAEWRCNFHSLRDGWKTAAEPGPPRRRVPERVETAYRSDRHRLAVVRQQALDDAKPGCQFDRDL